MKVNQAVVLAAGESSRFWPLSAGGRHKSLLKLLGKSTLLHTIEGLKSAGMNRIVVVEGPDRAPERELGVSEKPSGNSAPHLENVEFVVQSRPAGMGDAILCASNLLEEEKFFVLNADKVNAGLFLKKMASMNGDAVLLAGRTERPWDYGILTMDGHNGRAVGIVEKPARGSEPSDLKAIGVYLLELQFLEYYEKAKDAGMYAYEAALDEFMKNRKVSVLVTEKETPSLKYPWDALGLCRSMMDGKFFKPKIDKSAKIDTRAKIAGPVHIGKNTRVLENAVIKGPCHIGDGCTIGTFSLVRDFCDLEDGVEIGAFTEVARSIVQEGTHVHSGFIGDSIIGRNCRIGAGIVTANRRIDRGEIMPIVKEKKVGSGLTRLGLIMGDESHIGTCVNAMPGVMVGSKSVVGPSVLLKKNVNSGSRVFGQK